MPAASRLWNPGRQPLWKPQGPVAVDWGHPLAVGLRHFYLMNEGGGLPRNLVRSSESISLGTGVTWSRNSLYGTVLNFNNSTNGRAQMSTGFTPAATVFSADMLVRVAVSPASLNFEYLLGSASAAGDGLLLSNNVGSVVGWDIDTSTGDLQIGSLPTLNIWYHLVFVYVSTSSATIYQNGLSIASGAITGAFTTPLGWIGSDGTNASSNFGGDIGWLRIWDRALNQADVTSLYVDPFEMVVSGREEATLIAVLGASTSPVFTIGPLIPLMSPPSGGSIVSGSATIIGNSLIAESAQVVEPSTIQANSAIAESGQLVEPATIQSNSVVVESAQVVEGSTEQSNSVVVDAPGQVVAPATVQANSLIVENGQLVEATTEQANAAVVQSVGQVVDPSIPVIGNSILIATGGLAGAGGGTIISNSTLAETGAQIATAAPIAANASLVETAAQLLATAQQVGNAAVAETAARILATATAQAANSVLSVTGSVFNPSGVVAGDVKISDAALMTVTINDQPAQATVTIADTALMTVALADSAP